MSVQNISGMLSFSTSIPISITGGNAWVGGATAVIGIADGDATPGDWVLLAGAAAGILGIYASVCPVVGLTLSGVSIVLTIVDTCMNENNCNSSY